MKFIDEVIIRAEAGKGGAGCVSFRREKFIPFGGPDGGDGGDGGSVYLKALPNVSTLVDLHVNQVYKARDGESGRGRDCRGRQGDNLVVPVPVGTEVFDADTREFIGDLTQADKILLVSQGGWHGLGNTRFKSSTNRAPRQSTSGQIGESRTLRLSLKLIADVGLLGLPNAGKSSLLRAISSATPTVADYPFTTLHPQLGVVNLGIDCRFVAADIPGLIEGAATGMGLGVYFLKHLERTRLLLHVVDVLPGDGSDPSASIRIIEEELSQYGRSLLGKPRWLLLNKMDLIPEDYWDDYQEVITQKLDWKAPIFLISSLKRQGTQLLCYRVAEFLSKES